MCVCGPAGCQGLPGWGWGSGQSKGSCLVSLAPTPSLQTRSSRHTQGAQFGLADQAAKLSYASAESLETEAELPLGFSRMNRFRQLALSRSASQTKLRSPGTACPSSSWPLAPRLLCSSRHPPLLLDRFVSTHLLEDSSPPHPIFPPTLLHLLPSGPLPSSAALSPAFSTSLPHFSLPPAPLPCPSSLSSLSHPFLPLSFIPRSHLSSLSVSAPTAPARNSISSSGLQPAWGCLERPAA